MKKLIFALFIAGIFTLSISAADLKNKDVVGEWKYKVEMPEANLTGTLKITETDNKLTGQVNDDQGYVFQLLKIEILGEELVFELQPDTELIQVKSKLIDGKLTGIVKMNGQDLKFTAGK